MKAVLSTALILVVIAAAWLIWKGQSHPVAEAPQQSQTASSTSDSETDFGLARLPVNGHTATSGVIMINKPATGGDASSPVALSGKARGSWYFEASAPVMVVDAAGNILGRGHVEAQGDWMTSDFVPFSGSVSFEKPSTDAGTVVFMNDNPSGDPERSLYIAIPVFFR